jgi:hypothetical protein
MRCTMVAGPEPGGNMRILLLLPALVVALVSAYGCSGGGSTSSGAGGSTGTSTSTGLDSCEGVICAPPTEPLTLVVVDDMGQPVADPTFTEYGQPLKGVCETDAGPAIPQDAGTCISWNFYQLSPGGHTITVSAPGYEPTMFSFTFQGSMMPPFCSCPVPVSDTVTLQRSPADAGTD